MLDDTLLTHPLESASTAELDSNLVYLNNGFSNNGGVLNHLCRQNWQDIQWEALRHVRIIGGDGFVRLKHFEAWGFSPGCYLSGDGSWMMMYLPTGSRIDDCLSRCGSGLVSLWLWGTESLDRDWSSLSHLRSLYLRDTPALDTLSQFRPLSMLTELTIQDCPRLVHVSGLETLTALTKLDISGTEKLTALPGLEKLENLNTLRLFGCENLIALPGLEKLEKLNALKLFGCKNLTALPGLEKLEKLDVLDLFECKNLTALPGLEKLTQLTVLNLSGCRGLKAAPDVGNLTQLTELDLSECEHLITVPGLEKLTQLTRLKLFRCDSITALPGLEKLTRLTFLDLSLCRNLTKLPPLNALTQLKEMRLSACGNLAELPGLEHLTRLTRLDLSSCYRLTGLPGLGNLTQLTALYLEGCIEITALPGLENLSRLTVLKLAECSAITELPPGIRHLKQLRLLDLTSMHFHDLPDWLPEIADAFSLWYAGRSEGTKATVILMNTTVDNIDMSIFDQPYEMVVKWFEARRLGRTRPLNEIKVVFLGDGEAGKSHTIARLMNDGGEPDHAVFDGQATPGIVIRNKEYDLEGRKIRVHYWDFGGQEIMHSMHRIFLTGRTMYVILLNARDDTQGDRARYWLHNVKSFAPDAPVLLVLNKIDQNENASVDEVDLRGRYPKLTQVVRLSALKYSREEFNSRFTAVLLDQIRKTGYLDVQWPIVWTAVKEKLENMTGHYILGDDYQAICEECRVEDHRKDLLHWFNDLGISFCCCDEADYALEDYVILRPDWITNALYIILFNKLEHASNGLIPHKSIYQLLRNARSDPHIRCTLPGARYTPGDIQYVLGIMRKFNLSFTDGCDNEFVPMLCQQNSTVDVRSFHDDPDTLEFSMEFDYLPNNLLHRLMVERRSELDITKVWRTGAGFRIKELGLSALVVIDDRTLRFFIRHKDPMHRPNTYLTMLKAHTDRIVEKMGLTSPSAQLIYKLDGRQDVFDFEVLKAMQDAGQNQVFSMTWRKMIPIADILNQSAPDGLEHELKLLDAIRRSCRNIQGEPDYCLNGDGHGMEDKRNRRIRDDLFGWGYHIQDQSQRGRSGSGSSIGELDLLLHNEKRELWTAIEALRVSNGRKTEWNQHLTKLVGNYNFFGAPYLYLLTYVDADPGAFARIWKGYRSHIEKYDPGQYACCAGSFTDLNDAGSPQYIRTAKSCYTCGGDPITVYHIFVRISSWDE